MKFNEFCTKPRYDVIVLEDNSGMINSLTIFHLFIERNVVGSKNNEAKIVKNFKIKNGKQNLGIFLNQLLINKDDCSNHHIFSN